MSFDIKIQDNFASRLEEASIMSVIDTWQRYNQEQYGYISMMKFNTLEEGMQRRYDLLDKRMGMLERAFERKIVEITKKYETSNKETEDETNY